MKIYNALGKKVEEFTPIIDGQVKMYSCGPTVYAPAHIGNLSSYIYVDLLRRALENNKMKVMHVMNLTDVDDKTIRDSAKAHPELGPQERLEKFTAKYTKRFMQDMYEIGNDVKKVHFIRATESIEDIQRLIKKLLDEGVAYVADDGIYFDIKKHQQKRKYGQLTEIEPSTQVAHRISNDEYDKENVQDFALWKKTKQDEASWGFMVDGADLVGRPGWHIECSAMSVKALGQPFDIHTGGVDLAFPHHENEIAQSTAGDQPEHLANYFFHTEHLLVDNRKMSKSARNFYTLSDIIKRGLSPLDFRMLVLQGHYRKPTNFSWDTLEAAHNRLLRWKNFAALRHQLSDVDEEDRLKVERWLEVVRDFLQDDLDVASALAKIEEIIDEIGRQEVGHIDRKAVTVLFGFVDQNLGLGILQNSLDISENIKKLIVQREAYRADGNYARGDEIRDALLHQGIVLRDLGDLTLWERA